MKTQMELMTDYHPFRNLLTFATNIIFIPILCSAWAKQKILFQLLGIGMGKTVKTTKTKIHKDTHYGLSTLWIVEVQLVRCVTSKLMNQPPPQYIRSLNVP
jgi:hypothetical protein